MSTNTSKTPFCTICFNAGKNKSEYTNHWVRETPGGKVCCPTLLNHKCEYCKKLGHMLSHCRNLKRSNAAKTAKTAGKKFCGVCFNDGKSENEFTSHWVKESIGGKVCCPTLLDHECRYCKKKGHKISHCRKLLRRNARRTGRARDETVRKETNTPPSTRIRSRNALEKLSSPTHHRREMRNAAAVSIIRAVGVGPLLAAAMARVGGGNQEEYFQEAGAVDGGATTEEEEHDDNDDAPRPMAPTSPCRCPCLCPTPQRSLDSSKHVSQLPVETASKWGDEMYEHDKTGNLNTAC